MHLRADILFNPRHICREYNTPDMPQTSPRKPHDSRPVPLSHRRSIYGNYRGRCIYLFTLNVEGRKPLLGTLQGSMAEEAYVQPSALGKEILRLLDGIPAYQKQKAAEKSRKTGTECRRGYASWLRN